MSEAVQDFGRLIPDLAQSRVRPQTCLTASLHYLALQSPDPPGLAKFYNQALGYRILEQNGEHLGFGPDRRLIFSTGEAKALAEVGYALADARELERLRARIDRAAHVRTDGPTLLFEDAVSVRDPDGNRLIFGLPRPEPVSVAEGLPARIQHVVVGSCDPDRIVEFFTAVLGFTLSDNVIDAEGGVRTSFLRCNHEHHSFAVFKASENRLDHHCYETTDWNMIKDWCDRMAAARIPIQWGPGRHGPGNNLFVFIHDPDGNWVELSAELEHVEHDRPVGAWPHEQRTLNSWGQGLLRS